MLQKPFKIRPRHTESFLAISNDKNPAHNDPTYCSKTPFGYPIAYGISGLILAISIWIEKRSILLKKGKVTFHKPIYENQDYELVIQESLKESKVTLTVSRKATRYLSANLTFTDVASVCNSFKELEIIKSKDVAKKTSMINYKIEEQQYFEFLRNYKLNENQISHAQLTFLTWTSYFVGMESPGTQALYTKLCFEMNNSQGGKINLNKIDQHKTLGRYLIEGTGSFINNFSITAFKRPLPVSFDSQSIEKRMKNISFPKRKNCLVIGGARGFGSVLVKSLVTLNNNTSFIFRSNELEANAIKKDLDTIYDKEVTAHKCDLSDTNACLNLKLTFERYDYIFISAVPPIRTLMFDELGTKDFLSEFNLFSTVFTNSLKTHTYSSIITHCQQKAS